MQRENDDFVVNDNGLGIVRTDPRLVNKQLDEIPEEIWLNPTKTFLDPCFGNGTYLKEIGKRLHRKYGFSKENIESRLYGVEINTLLYLGFKQLENFKPKLINKDFLKWNTKMKFDVIIGNPPYQYPKELGKGMIKKLYTDMTLKAFSLLKNGGILSFLTPNAIFIKRRVNDNIKKVQKIFEENNLVYINEEPNKYFPNVAVDVCSWYLIKETSQNKTSVKTKERNFKEIKLPYKEGAEIHQMTEDYLLTKSIIEKMMYKLNGKEKCPIVQSFSDRGIIATDIVKEKINDDYVEVYCNTKKQRIKYTHKDNLFKMRKIKKIIIPYVGGYLDENSIFIGDIPINYMFFTNKNEMSISKLNNLKKYLESPLVKYCVINHSFKYKKEPTYNMLSKISGVNLDKIWTNEELYKEFNIAENEIKEIEKWSNKSEI